MTRFGDVFCLALLASLFAAVVYTIAYHPERYRHRVSVQSEMRPAD